MDVLMAVGVVWVSGVLPLQPARGEVPPSAPPTTLVLTTGEVLRGTLVASGDAALTLEHPVLGRLVVPRGQVVRVVETPKDAPATLPAPVPPVVPAPPPPPQPESIWEGWRGSLEGGLSGASGNSETFAVRAAVGLKREGEQTETELKGAYTFGTADGAETTNRGEIDGRNDWRIGESPWGLFALGRLEYDEFTNYRWRVSGSMGPSYTLIKPEPVLLRLRLGVGGAYEWAGPSPMEEFVPEGLAGVDLEWAINERQSLFLNADYLPSLQSPPHYRVDAKAGWQIMVDPESRLYLKLGVADRYSSSPGGQKNRNDIEYFLTFGWGF